jgi:hypothetical protein
MWRNTCRCATSEEDGVDYCKAMAAGTSDVLADSIYIINDEIIFISPCSKGAVVTSVTAKRDVYIHPKLAHNKIMPLVE